MKIIFVAFSKIMMNTTTMLVHIKGLTRDFLYQFQDEKAAQRVEYEGEISWGASSTITKDSLHLRFIPMDRVFTPYRLSNHMIFSTNPD
jgi:hypothetical protein